MFALRPTLRSAASLAPRVSTRNLAQMTLVGRVTAPESKTSRNGQPFHKFAVVDRVRGPEGEFVSHFYNVSCFDPSKQEYISKLNKGDTVYVVADVLPNQYEREGAMVHTYNLTARNIQIIYRARQPTEGEEEQH